MSRIIYDGHIQVLVLLTTGQEPTVPVPSTLTPVDEGWDEETDIMIGEFAVNKVDDIVWTRTDNGIIQINAGGSGAVSSVFGRTGSVVAQSGDYTASQVGAQPLDSDLTDIASLSPSNDDILQRKSGAWTNRTPSQVAVDLASSLIKQTITNGATGTAPSEDVVFDTVSKKLSVVAQLFHTAQSFGDNITVFFGKLYASQTNAGAGNRKFSFDKDVVISSCNVTIHQTTPQGSNEAVNYYLRVDNTTDHLLFTADFSSFAANSCRTYNPTGLSISVSAGVDCEIKVTTGSMATNPTNVSSSVELLGYEN